MAQSSRTANNAWTVTLFELDAAHPGSFVQEMTIDLDRSWSVEHLGVAAFIQDPTSLKIEGASSKYPIARN